jgi:hypothetical protein
MANFSSESVGGVRTPGLLHESEKTPEVSRKVEVGRGKRGRVMTDAERAKALRTRRERKVPINVAGVPMRRRQPGEVPSRGTAIRAHCRECCGWDSGGLGSVAANVRACTARECWLWPYRNGALCGEA